jgi:hypothetical protein
MREAWDRTGYERKKENKRREKNGSYFLNTRSGSFT